MTLKVLSTLTLVACVTSSTFADYVFSKKDILDHGWYAKGVAPGRYYVQLELADELANVPLYHEGEALDFTVAGPWERRDGVDRMVAEAGPVEVKDGDFFYFADNLHLYSLTLAEKPLAYAPQKLFVNAASAAPNRYAIRGAFADGKVDVKITSRFGHPQTASVSVVVSDFWQRELAREEKKITLAHETALSVPFVDTLTGQQRAWVTVTEQDGRVTRHLIIGKADAKTPYRETVRFDTGWERALAKDDGTVASRTLTADPPADAKWQAVEMPSEIKEARAWFRATRTVPASFAGRRVIFRIQRQVGASELYIDGKKAAEFGKDLNWNGTLEADITDFVTPGKSQAFLLAALKSDFAGLPPEELEKKSPNQNLALASIGLRSAIGEIVLEARGPQTIGLVKVFTSYRDKTLKVTAEHPAGFTVRNTVYRQDKKLLSFEAETVWQQPLLWGPTEFPLLRLVTELVDAKGTVVDAKETRFGFREIWCDGMDYLWNGHVVRGDSRAFLSSWGWNLDHRCKRQATADSLVEAQRRGVKFLRHIYNSSEHLDLDDELGFLVCKGGMCPAGPAPEKSANTKLWATKEMNDRKMIESHFNHPSVMTWYVSNEYYGECDDPHHKPIASAVRNAQAADPTRTVEAGCDIDVRGTMQIFSTHYPVELQAFRSPDCYMPYCFYWRPIERPFEKGEALPCGQVKSVANCSILSPMKWGTKPIMINETCWEYFFAEPLGYTRLVGDEVFEQPSFRNKAHIATDVEAVRGHRDAGVTLWTTWRWYTADDIARVSPEIDVVNIQRYRNFYTGTAVKYDVNCFYDVWKADAFTWFWQLEDKDGKAVLACEPHPWSVAFAATARETIAFTAPEPGRYTLRFGLKGRCEKTLAVTVFPKPSADAPSNVIAASTPLDKTLLTRAEAGETIVLLAREDYPEWLPEVPGTTGFSAAILRTFRADHPVLKGISADKFSYFWPNSIAAEHGFLKPSAGNARTILEFGGPSGLNYAALVEVPYGKGCFLYSRLVLDQGVNPVADRLVRQMAAYRRTGEAGTALYLAGTDKTLENALKVMCGVTFEKGEAVDAAKCAAVLVDGSRTLSAAEIAALKASGKTVFVFNPGSEFGLATRPVTAKAWKGRAVVRGGEDPLVQGLTNNELMWRGKFEDEKTAIADLGAAEFADPSGALLYPNYAKRDGNFVFLTADPKIKKAAVNAMARRFWSTLFSNAGIRLVPFAKVAMPKGLTFTTLDLSAYLDRTLTDEKADDGLGSWNDQGMEQHLPMKFSHPIAWVGKVPYDVKPSGPCAVTLKTEHRTFGVSNVVLKVGRTVDTVNWLYSSAWTSKGKLHYTVHLHYTDGTTATVEGRGGANVEDCFKPQPDLSEEIDTLTSFRSWKTSHPVFPNAHVYSTSWANPHPKKVVETIEFVRGQTRCAVIGLFAVTIGHLDNPYAAMAKSDRETLHDQLCADALKAQNDKRFTDAITLYEKALLVVPGRVWVYRSIGSIYEGLRDWESALETYRRSLDADFNQPDMWEAEKNMLKKLGRAK